MVGPSLNTTKPTPTTTIKFLSSYGGKILPRYPDGKLRYVGGETRVLAVDRSISFSELLMKLGELCSASVSLRCQLPSEDLDALVSITSDEDLANLIEEYDRAPSPPSSLKIRAFLSPPKPTRKSISSPPILHNSSSKTTSSLSSSSSSASPSSSLSPNGSTPRFSAPVADVCHRQILPPAVPFQRSAAKIKPHCAYHANGKPSHSYLIHNGNHWQ
ncbi:pectinesterase inhibitor 10-like [Fagus crenata]